jgi:hypothetical protein
VPVRIWWEEATNEGESEANACKGVGSFFVGSSVFRRFGESQSQLSSAALA